ncbi:MAG TPA: ornithine carbamoyltransferase [Fimbriimonadaceae bacterium]|jgi:ornithine carbamoyltransferase
MISPLDSNVAVLPDFSDSKSGLTDVAKIEISAARMLIESDKFSLRGKSLVSMADLDKKQLYGVLQVAAAMDSAHRAGVSLFRFPYQKSLAMIFEKPSLRTRVTFDLGMRQLGGLTVLLGPHEIGMGKRESVPDVAKNLERWVDAIMARVFEHDKLTGLRDHGSVPVINALSDYEHPCQTLADLYTILQYRGTVKGLKIAYVGDGNNVLHSLMLGIAIAGGSMVAACPTEYQPNEEVVRLANELAHSGEKVSVIEDPREAVAHADIVYTDAWTSMGQEAEAKTRMQVFMPYQVNKKLLSEAKRDAIFMHCLPAHRGEEVTDEVLDGPQSVVYDQAENRLHAQKAVLALLVGP